MLSRGRGSKVTGAVVGRRSREGVDAKRSRDGAKLEHSFGVCEIAENGGGVRHAASFTSSPGEVAPSVASDILIARGSDGWRWPYTILRIVFSASPMRAAKSATVSDRSLR